MSGLSTPSRKLSSTTTRVVRPTAKGFLVELGPGLRTGAKDQQTYRLAAVAQSHDEQPSASVLATLLVAHHRTGAVVDLGFFARCRQNNTDGLRAVSAVQLTDEALDRLIAAAIAVLIDQVLPDGCGVASTGSAIALCSRDTVRRYWRWDWDLSVQLAVCLRVAHQSRWSPDWPVLPRSNGPLAHGLGLRLLVGPGDHGREQRSQPL